MQLLVDHWQNGRYKTRAFTVDRSEVLFAVQTSRLLLLLDRYRNEIKERAFDQVFEDIRSKVVNLTDHIDELVYGEQSLSWLQYKRGNLKWPKGSKFYFDGLNVPFNHQNEWAFSVVRAGNDKGKSRKAAIDIVQHFISRIATQGLLPNTGAWDYWWGKAYDGWTVKENVSVNMPSYKGDHIKAWISFRTIDVMSCLAISENLDVFTRSNIIKSSAYLMATGKIYPFAGSELIRNGVQPFLQKNVVKDYIRVSSPWEFSNAPWAYMNYMQKTDKGSEVND